MILLIKRKLRGFVNFSNISQVLNATAARTGRSLYVFDDAHLPSFENTTWLFHRADVIVAPHGAGLSNILFARPGTTIIEAHCHEPAYIRMSFRQLSLKLGMRYHGMLSTQRGQVTDRCNRSGVTLDMNEFEKVVSFIADNILTGK